MTVKELKDILSSVPDDAYVMMESDKHLEPAEIVEKSTDVVVRYDDTHFLEEPIVILKKGL